MAKRRNMNVFTIRVDILKEDTKERLLKVLEATTKHFVAYEISDVEKKPHYQGVVYTPMAEHAFRKIILDFIPEVKGTKRGRPAKEEGKDGKYSCKPVKDLDDYSKYVCKGADSASLPVVLSNNLWSDEEVKELHRRRHEEQAKKALAKKKVQGNAFTKALDYVKDKLAKEPVSESKLPQFVYGQLIRYYLDNTKCEAGDHQLWNMTKSILTHIHYERDPNRCQKIIDERARSALVDKYYPVYVD